MTTNRTRLLEFVKRSLEYRHLPIALAIVAILVMLPALKLGLGMDDLPQRAVELRPDQLPAGIHEAGNPVDSGSFSTVLRELFYDRSPQDMALMRNYGVLPWWQRDDLKLNLWRPVSAFTHWLDYQLFPGSPALMHAHNIAWFAAIVFIATVIYRKLMGAGWAAGLASLLFLLDSNTYLPVAFVANRGFMMSLFFGLMCLYAHHQWRSAKAISGLFLSMLFLTLSLLSDESGASTFAFVLAYAFALESGSLRRRALTILPSVFVIVLWRLVYNLSGFGIIHVGLYIDPATEPFEFARQVIPRAIILLGSQLNSVAPDVLFALSPEWKPVVIALFFVCAAAALVIFLPWMRRDKIALYWFAVMVFAAIPAATVVPIAKNMGFVAFGAYGLIASFVAGLIKESGRFPISPAYRRLAWVACILLLLVHVPGAIVARAIGIKTTSDVFSVSNHLSDIDPSPNPENQDVIVINAPSVFTTAYAPFYKAYCHQPLPRSIRMLVPGCTSFDVQRTDDKTLVIQSKSPDIFSCEGLGAIHLAYVFSTFSRNLCGPSCKKGDVCKLRGLTITVLDMDSAGLPSRVAFQFDSPLDSPGFFWLQFDWPTWTYKSFKVPAIGQSVTLSGPSPQVLQYN